MQRKQLTLSLMLQHHTRRNFGIHHILVNCLTLRCRVPICITRIPIPQSQALPSPSSNRLDVVVVVPKRRPHERGLDTEDPRESFLNAEHSILELGVGYTEQVGMGPSMGADHMPGSVGVLDVGDTVGVVDAVPVIAVEEKGSFCFRGGELV
jgi:hypothetical protein